MDFSLIVPAFLAGILTFLAPCTLPLVPGYLGFISGVSSEDKNQTQTRRKVFLNGVFYVLGFSLVFITLGILFGLLGFVAGPYRVWFSRVGGIFVIIFGLYLTGVLKLSFLNFLQSEKRLNFTRHLKPGHPVSSLIFGATFAFGWTPCVGPILGSILALAAAKTTVLQGGFLLLVFSAGLAVPFLLVALGIGSAAQYIQKIQKYLKAISIIGGLLLVIMGVLLLTDQFGAWVSFFYQNFNILNYEGLLDYL